MTYDPTGLSLVAQGVTQGQVYVYEGTDTPATVIAAGFISNAYDIGMRVGATLHVKQFSNAAKTALVADSMHSVTAVADGVGATASAALAGGTANGVLSGTSSPDANLDTLDGAIVGTVYVDTNGDHNAGYAEPFVATAVGTAGAIWMSIANDMVFAALNTTILTSAGQTLERFVAPWAGRLIGFRAMVMTVATGATNKIAWVVISGNTVASGFLTLGDGDAAQTKYAAAPTTDNAFAAGNEIKIQTGAQPCATGRYNMFVVCRKMATS